MNRDTVVLRCACGEKLVAKACRHIDTASQPKLEEQLLRGELNAAKCPKCGAEVAEPKKTWKMTGRPDKRGRRLTLDIGLFQCPTHGAFRITLNKQKT